MSNPINPLNEQIAGQLSGGSYSAPTEPFTSAKGLPAGWRDITGELQEKTRAPYHDGHENPANASNEFRVFANDSTHQVVMTFKGSNSAQNWESDLNPRDQGYSSYQRVQENAQKYFDQIKDDPNYKNYAKFTDGHSLGGGMAQCFAIQNNISGFGQNSLPIPDKFIQNYKSLDGEKGPKAFEKDLATQRETQKFDEVNVAGDIATNFYSASNHLTGGQYINKNPRTLDSPYQVVEDFSGPSLVSLGVGAKAHMLGSYEKYLEKAGNYGNWAPMGKGAEPAARTETAEVIHAGTVGGPNAHVSQQSPRQASHAAQAEQPNHTQRQPAQHHAHNPPVAAGVVAHAHTTGSHEHHGESQVGNRAQAGKATVPTGQLTHDAASALPVTASRKETTDHLLAALLSDNHDIMHAGLTAGLNTHAAQQGMQHALQAAQANQQNQAQPQPAPQQTQNPSARTR